MANVTLSIDEDVLRRARIKAIEQNTSVNAVVREFLESYAGKDKMEHAKQEFLRIARESTASSGPEGRTWTREDIYEDRLGRFGPR
jgi:hypothetical protein